ncbi:putative sugar (and other) transporter [Lyophyllum shimeji]|uniref:Sugar (And other) transporter n=1 Tax=Lyophyllum shimeji TaxID=47721 RepID=A0A9P3Q1E9_LYOSH|nr:putative sugar (and other) transporter [Lyophyllum shimeji]
MQPINTTRASQSSSESGKLPYGQRLEDVAAERLADMEKDSPVPAEELQLDRYGLPLVPQPSRFKDDPLNWPPWLKWAVLIQVSFMAFLGPFNAAVVNPSLVLLGQAFHEPTNIVVYNTTIAIITGGLASFIWAPLTNVYGRRPITILSQLCAILGNIGSARSTTFSALLGARAVTGIGMAGMMSVGTACVNDMFFMHERGEKTGVYTIFVTNGGHIAFLGGGFLAQKAGWAWDFYLPAVITSCSMIFAIFLFPETLFSRHPQFLSDRKMERTYRDMLFNLKGNLVPQRRLQAQDFLTSFYMLKYPSISLCFWYYTWSWTFVNILPAISMAKLYTDVYHLKSGIIGLCIGVPLTIGSLLGELSAGRLSDYIMSRLAKRRNDVRKPEHRLYLTPLGAAFMPAGMIVFGICVQKHAMFVVPLVGLAISAFGLQITSTCLYSYVSDCYKPQTPESAVLMNLGRGLSFVIGFFGLPYAERVGYHWGWTTFALILLVFYIPVLMLMRYGEMWRKSLGPPEFHQYI